MGIFAHTRISLDHHHHHPLTALVGWGTCWVRNWAALVSPDGQRGMEGKGRGVASPTQNRHLAPMRAKEGFREAGSRSVMLGACYRILESWLDWKNCSRFGDGLAPNVGCSTRIGLSVFERHPIGVRFDSQQLESIPVCLGCFGLWTH